MQRTSNTGGWKERRTVDGGEYYHNVETDEVSWEKPLELQSAEERKVDTSDCVWLPSEQEGGWVPAYVSSRSGGKVRAKPVQGGKEVTVNPKEVFPLKMSHLDKRFMQDDLVLLESLDRPLMAYNLRHRYQEDKIYTWVGADHTVLISLNPFKRLPIYGAAALAEYSEPSPNRLQSPHTFAIANSAYRALRADTRSSISILISGESGAGKTECTKQCLQFLAEVAGSQSGVEQRILQANPILEAFGNAKTLRNDNSSRFGRWMEVHFFASGRNEGEIAGAFVENYLLEKSRVVGKSQQGERSYHVFYQLAISEWAPSLSLDNAASYRYLASCTHVPSIDDAADFEAMSTAFSAMGFSGEDVQWVFYVTAAVLHLGNLDFTPTAGGEGSALDSHSQQLSALAAHYLQVDAGALAAALVERQIAIRGEVQHMRNTVEKAYEAVEALAKAVYSNVFDDLVRRINSSVGGERGSSIGVLDIFGFEIFEVNSFEQLCINFTNEKLQAKFNSHTFTQEESLYKAEGVPFQQVAFVDNAPVIELLAAKPYGLMNLLDEEVRMPQGGDDKYLAKITERQRSSRVFAGPGENTSIHSAAFLVKHYAGDVVYDVRGMLEKNADRLSRNLYMLLTAATNPRTAAIFPEKDERTAGKVSTVGEKFRGQLNRLMDAVNKTKPYFIRCIKPNHAKAPQQLQMKMVIEQLTYAGVFEAVKIRKSGYPFRLPHAEFASTYRWIARKANGWAPIHADPNAHPAEYCRAVLAAVHQDFSQVHIGQTLVLYRAEEYRVLELLKNLALGRVLQYMQAAFRRKMGRTYRSLLRGAIATMARALAEVKAQPEIGPREVQLMEVALQQYHDHLGRFGAIFAEYEPPEYEQVQELYQLAREIELKKLYLDQQGASLELRLCPLLTPPSIWATGKLLGSKQARADGMLRFTDASLHKPLCRLEVASSDKKEQARLGKEVVGQFKNLLGWQGIKKASYPEQLAEEWLRYGAANPLMCGELYAQLMKQLSDAPGGQETQQAWQLLIASLSHWAPPEGLADFVAYFLRTHGPHEWTGKFDRLLASTLHRVAAGKALASSFSVAACMSTFHGQDEGMPAGRRVTALANGGPPGAPPGGGRKPPPPSGGPKPPPPSGGPKPPPPSGGPPGGGGAPGGRRPSGGFNNVWSKGGSGGGWGTQEPAPSPAPAPAPAPAAEAPSWYYVDASSGTQLGPVDGATLRRMVAEGTLSGSTHVWGVSLANWTPLEQVAELAPPAAAAPLAQRQPAPPPPAAARAAQEPSPHAALLFEAAAAAERLKVHEGNAAAQGDAAAAGAWRTFLNYLQGLIDQVGAPGAGAEVQEQADALKAAVGQVPPLG